MKNILIPTTIITTILFLLSNSSLQGQTANSEAMSKKHVLGKWVQLPDTLTFCGEVIPLNDPEVRERAEDIFYTRLGDDDRFYLLLRRTSRYFPFYEKVFREMELPSDLKYLSVAESSLRIDAYSSADATGLWQFIAGTAKIWGLRVDKYADERFHVEKSTRAACTLLKNLRMAFGSWSLAAAAYNTGEANIEKAVDGQHDDNYYNLFLNKETRQYVIHIAVLKEILEHPEKYGYAIPDSSYFKPFDDRTETIALKGPVKDLGLWAKSIGTNYKTIKMLNFWIMRYDLPEGIWELRVPEGLSSDSSLMQFWQSKNDSIIYGENNRVTIFHTVQPGESQIRIAAMYSISIQELKDWNGLKNDAVVVNQKLKLKIPAHTKIQYPVRSGDNLLKIAEQFKVTAARIKEWNKRELNGLQAGEVLTIYIGRN